MNWQLIESNAFDVHYYSGQWKNKLNFVNVIIDCLWWIRGPQQHMFVMQFILYSWLILLGKRSIGVLRDFLLGGSLRSLFVLWSKYPSAFDSLELSTSAAEYFSIGTPSTAFACLNSKRTHKISWACTYRFSNTLFVFFKCSRYIGFTFLEYNLFKPEILYIATSYIIKVLWILPYVQRHCSSILLANA